MMNFHLLWHKGTVELQQFIQSLLFKLTTLETALSDQVNGINRLV
jgi:hypothetical protein